MLSLEIGCAGEEGRVTLPGPRKILARDDLNPVAEEIILFDAGIWRRNFRREFAHVLEQFTPSALEIFVIVASQTKVRACMASFFVFPRLAGWLVGWARLKQGTTS